jgi:hypothetical protein
MLFFRATKAVSSTTLEHYVCVDAGEVPKECGARNLPVRVVPGKKRSCRRNEIGAALSLKSPKSR